MTTVHRMTEEQSARWDEFVLEHPDATFFHLVGWKSVLERALGHATYYLYAEVEGALTGVLPLVHVKSLLFGNSLSSLAFCAYGGALARDEASLTALEAAAIELGGQLGVGAVEFRYRRASARQRPTKLLYETFSKPLHADLDANMQAIRSKQRNIIRKGMKNGLESRDDTIENFYGAYSESVRNLGTPVFPKALFAAIRDVFPRHVQVLSVYRGDAIVSSAMNFYFRNEVCPYYWGGVHAARQLNGNDFLAWEIMRHAAGRGCTVFDFGRSKKDTGSYQWKVNLGFTPTPLYYEYELIRDRQMPDINPMNPKYRMFVEAWKHLPLPVSRLVGPWLARSLG